MSDTPRTDKATVNGSFTSSHVPADAARDIERDLNAIADSMAEILPVYEEFIVKRGLGIPKFRRAQRALTRARLEP